MTHMMSSMLLKPCGGRRAHRASTLHQECLQELQFLSRAPAAVPSAAMPEHPWESTIVLQRPLQIFQVEYALGLVESTTKVGSQANSWAVCTTATVAKVLIRCNEVLAPCKTFLPTVCAAGAVGCTVQFQWELSGHKRISCVVLGLLAAGSASLYLQSPLYSTHRHTHLRAMSCCPVCRGS